MSVIINGKTVPRSILIFGASGDIGGPLADFLHRSAPGIQLRLASSRLERIDDLRRDFPDADVVHADYFDLSSLESAVHGVEGIFVNTPGGTDETPAILNNGHDLMRFSDVADVMSDVFGEKVTHDGSMEAFFDTYSQQLGPLCSQLWNFFEYERENEVVWARNDFLERALERKPLTVREWLQEHAQLLLN
jgi:hypothetical protein